MNDIEKILRNKETIVSELYDWATTFDDDLDKIGEKNRDGYQTISNLAFRLENGLCSKKDYEDIAFQIWQINYDEIIIDFDTEIGGMPN